LWKQIGVDYLAEFTLSEILRSLSLRYTQGFGSPLGMTRSEGLLANS